VNAPVEKIQSLVEGNGGDRGKKEVRTLKSGESHAEKNLLIEESSKKKIFGNGGKEKREQELINSKMASGVAENERKGRGEKSRSRGARKKPGGECFLGGQKNQRRKGGDFRVKKAGGGGGS